MKKNEKKNYSKHSKRKQSILFKIRSVFKTSGIIGVIVTLILGFISGFASSVFFDNFKTYRVDIKNKEIIKTLQELDLKGNAKDMQPLLGIIKNRDGMGNEYRYFKGCFYYHNDSLSLYGPEKYFYSVDPDNEFYRNANHKLISYYSNVYKNDDVMLKESFKKVHDNLMDDGENISLIYYLRLRMLDDDDYDNILQLQNEYLDHYTEFRIESGFIYVHGGKTMNLSEVTSMQPMYYLFKTNLLFAAFNNREYDKIDAIINDIDAFRAIVSDKILLNNFRSLNFDSASIIESFHEIEYIRSQTNEMLSN